VSRIAAIAGCKAGWFVLRETPLPGPWHWFIAPTFEEAMERLDSYEVVAVDVPLSVSELHRTPSDDAELGVYGRYRRPEFKIRQVHEYVRSHPGAAHNLYEVHPRLSFLELEGGGIRLRKAGRKLRFRDRLSYLCDVYPSATLYEALTEHRRGDVSKADVLDAFAMLWSSKRIATSRAERLPSTPVYDAHGFDMAIWY
jgi:predicted RNase H-like nuclease